MNVNYHRVNCSKHSYGVVLCSQCGCDKAVSLGLLQINTRKPGMDVNVTGAWRQNITGRAVTVAVIDDGTSRNVFCLI